MDSDTQYIDMLTPLAAAMHRAWHKHMMKHVDLNWHHQVEWKQKEFGVLYDDCKHQYYIVDIKTFQRGLLKHGT